MIRVHSLTDGRLTTAEGAEAIPDGPAAAQRLWVEAVEPTHDEQVALVVGLGLHELALEDALSEGHPPKVEDFGSHLFLIAHTPDPVDERWTRKVSIFLSKTWLVSVERTDVPALEDVAERVRRDPKRYLAAPSRLAHALLDEMTEGFESLTDRMGDRGEALEEEVLAHAKPHHLNDLLGLRRQLTHMSRMVRDQRDAAQILVRAADDRNDDRLPREVTPYLRDVQDHLNRVYAQMDVILHSLTAGVMAYQSQVNNRLSDTMRVLTVVATVLMPLQLITGFFGMNFQHIPGLRSPAAFWTTLVVMVGTAAAMIALFRRRGWI